MTTKEALANAAALHQIILTLDAIIQQNYAIAGEALKQARAEVARLIGVNEGLEVQR